MIKIFIIDRKTEHSEEIKRVNSIAIDYFHFKFYDDNGQLIKQIWKYGHILQIGNSDIPPITIISHNINSGLKNTKCPKCNEILG